MMRKQVVSRLYLCISFVVSSMICFSQACNTVALDSISNSGEYSFGILTESDGLRNGPDYSGATIYYPIDASPPFTSIAIVPGYISAQSTIQLWGPYLASHGIVTMTIGTNSLFDDPIDRKDALLDALVTLAEENTRTDSPLLGDMDTDRMAVGGWSMGGGGAQLAAVADTSIKAVIALCPWLDISQLEVSDLEHSVPLLIFSGEQDVIAPPQLHADVHYDYTPLSTDKLIFELDNEGHDVANDPAGGDGDVGKIAFSWLQKHIVGDSCYCPLLLDIPSTSSKYETNVECEENITSTTSASLESDFVSRLYPNPCSQFLNLDILSVGQHTNYEILSLAGVKMAKGVVSHQITTIDIGNLTSGVYLMNLIRDHKTERIKFVVL